MSSTGMPRGRVLGCSAAALETEAEGRPSSFKAGTSRTIWGPPLLTVGRVGEAALALYYKSEQSLAYCVCNKPQAHRSKRSCTRDRGGMLRSTLRGFSRSLRAALAQSRSSTWPNVL